MNADSGDPAEQESEPDATSTEDGASTPAESADTEAQATSDRAKIERQPAPTPFDHPLAFPALLLALGLWFGYDGWFNPEIKSIGFNRVMFVICSLAFVWTLLLGLREMREDRQRKEQT